MSCSGIRSVLRPRAHNQSWMLRARNVSQLTNFLQQIYREKLPDRNVSYNVIRFRHCRRMNPCELHKIQKAAEEAKAKKPLPFWQALKASFFEKKQPKPKPPLHHCRLLQQRVQWQEEPIPEFIKEMCKDLPPGAAMYRTRGHAFILEVPCKKEKCKKKSRSEILLSKMERSKQSINLEDENNPMPSYSNCGQRLLDLQARKLHPLYQKLEQPLPNHPKPWSLETKYRCESKDMYKQKLLLSELYYNRKKNTFADFKMSVLPKYLQLREKAYNINTHSNLEFRRERMPVGRDGFREKPLADCKMECDRWMNQKPRH